MTDAPEREKIAEAIWHVMAPDHHIEFSEEFDKERYFCAADAILALPQAPLEWRNYGEGPDEGTEMLVKSDELIDEDFNEEGIAVGTVGSWGATCAVWDGYQDRYYTRLLKPEEFKVLPLSTVRADLSPEGIAVKPHEHDLDWVLIGKKADEYGVRFQTNTKLVKFLREAFPAPVGWRSMESAPKDKPIQAFSRGKQYVVQWDGEFEEWRVAHGVIIKMPTHWMPLPSAPGEQAANPVAEDQGPDWEGFGRSIMDYGWPGEIPEIEGSDIFDLAEAHNLIREIPGGFNPDIHHDDVGVGPEPGDEWYEFNFSGKIPVSDEKFGSINVRALQEGQS